MQKSEIQKMCVDADTSVKKAMEQMDATGLKILLVTNELEDFIGVLTDGDIRRKILKDGHLNGQIDDCVNKKPIIVTPQDSLETIKATMARLKCEIIPCVNHKKKVEDVYVWSELFNLAIPHRAQLNIPVVIMAGGKGSRMSPITNVLPKPLIPIHEEPIIDIIMKGFHHFGVSDFYMTLNYKRDLILSYLDHNSYPFNIHPIKEESFLGTAGSLKLLPKGFAEECFVSNCDILVDLDYQDLYDFHQREKNDFTIVGSVQHHQIPYGIIDFSSTGVVHGIREKPEYNFTINTGIYLIKTHLFDYIKEDGVTDMTDLMETAIQKGHKVSVYPVSSKAYSDIGQWEAYQNTLNKFSE